MLQQHSIISFMTSSYLCKKCSNIFLFFIPDVFKFPIHNCLKLFWNNNSIWRHPNSTTSQIYWYIQLFFSSKIENSCLKGLKSFWSELLSPDWNLNFLNSFKCLWIYFISGWHLQYDIYTSDIQLIIPYFFHHETCTLFKEIFTTVEKIFNTIRPQRTLNHKVFMTDDVRP